MKTLIKEIKADLAILQALTERIDQIEEKQAIALGLARVGIWELDLITNEIDWDTRMYEIFELNPDEFIATYEAFEPLVHPDDVEKMKETMSRSLKSRETCEYLHRIKVASGWKWIKGWGRTLFDANHQPVKMIGACVEI